MPMTPDAKRALSTTIRSLRERLLRDLHAATESAYRLSVPADAAELDEAALSRRTRLEAWVSEQLRAQRAGKPRAKNERCADDMRCDAEKQAAYTLLNRLVLLKLMESPGPQGQPPLRSPAVVTGAWDSRAYKDFKQLAPALVIGDESEGYAFLLKLTFDDLSVDLPGLYGPAGVADLVPVPPSTLRHVIEALDAPALASCWSDDMTLGWVYQYWNDPEREVLDAKINGGGKIEPHEIASKTQMFTERYMVDWLLQNTLGPLWLAICAKNGWVAEVHADGTLTRLEERRAAWRAKRAAGEVALTDLMPLETESERRWAYYLPQELPAGAAKRAPASLRELKLIDPAMGSGHFLVVALDLLFALYREEARHRGPESGSDWSDAAIVEHIVEHNLYGLDIDPRAVQIGAAALWLKGRQLARAAHPARMNLVASNLRLASLPDDDAAIIELGQEVERATGIPQKLTSTIIKSLRGADHLGSLLKVDKAVDDALAEHEGALGRAKAEQGQLFAEEPFKPVQPRARMSVKKARSKLITMLERFLSQHTSGDDLGLRLRGEQLAAGVRFARMMQEGQYDLVVANPPYQGTSKMADAKYIEQHYPQGKADLYAAFLLRGLELVKDGGVSAMLTLRNWMFLKQYASLRSTLLTTHSLRALGDFDRGAFEDIPDEVVSVVVSAFERRPIILSDTMCPTIRRAATRCYGIVVSAFERKERCIPANTVCHTPKNKLFPNTKRLLRKRAATLCCDSVIASAHEPIKHSVVPQALCPTPRNESPRDAARTLRKRAATLCHEGRHSFKPAALKVVPEWPLVYWWTPQLLTTYKSAPLIQDIAPSRFGATTGNNTRFVRRSWEIFISPDAPQQLSQWVPFINGAKGRAWLEDLNEAIEWRLRGLAYRSFCEVSTGANFRSPEKHFTLGVAFSMIGAAFTARVHRYPSVFGNMGSSTFTGDLSATVCVMNSSRARFILSSLNPGVHFEVGDVNRLPLFPITAADQIFAQVETAFGVHESHREPSIEFRRPGPSPWRYAQDWAQRAVDRAEGEPLPAYVEERDEEPGSDHLSYALGVALGRFGTAALGNEGILDPATADLSHALPHGILFLDGTLSDDDHCDGLGHAAAAPVHEAWRAYKHTLGTKKGLREWLASEFFKDVHRTMYENRPIHWPLSSSGKTFVAWVNIHRMNEQTLRILLADHLHPTLTRLAGELNDLKAARDGADKKAARVAEKQLDRVLKAHDELSQFIGDVERCADKGAPPADAKSPKREQDARYAPDLDDGVMINAAALWPLLEPQWKDPKKWWKELSQAEGRKDYDWSHLAMRYWPARVDEKCKKDPSLGVAHGCFWRYHAERAWAWELRLQDEIGPDFKITEAPYAPGGRSVGDSGDGEHRARFLRENPEAALAAIEKEGLRRIKRNKSGEPIAALRLLEAGLWASHPTALWDLEMRLSEKQGAELRVTAPDEPEARAKLERERPDQAHARSAKLAQLTPPPRLFEDEDEAREDDAQAEGEEDEA